jgi:formate-dependent phosphoribosylglycinamide formyltransferase (GAR transformylase)
LGDTEEARAEFERELASGGRGIYGAEFMMNAYDGLGFARLVDGDMDGARAMFAQSLETFPGHARSLLGLATACHRADLAPERDAAIERAARAIEELGAGHRVAEAFMATAFSHIVGGRQSDAIATLGQLLAAAPPGFAGWTIPIEPFFAGLRAEPSFRVVLSRLADRAR